MYFVYWMISENWITVFYKPLSEYDEFTTLLSVLL